MAMAHFPIRLYERARLFGITPRLPRRQTDGFRMNLFDGALVVLIVGGAVGFLIKKFRPKKAPAQDAVLGTSLAKALKKVEKR